MYNTKNHIMKRKASSTVMGSKSAKKRRTPYRSTGTAVVAYSGSMVPMRTGGYKPNSTERKVNDLAAATYNVSTTGSITLLANPTLGSDFNNRIGRKIVLKSVYIRGFVRTEPSLSNPAAFSQSQLVRMVILADLQPNGAAPALTDIFVEAHSASQLNLNNRDRFKVYCDKQWVLDPYLSVTTATQAQAFASNQVKPVKKYKKLNLETIYGATSGGTIADINSGALYMVWLGNVASGTNTDANAVVSTRVRYVDA